MANIFNQGMDFAYDRRIDQIKAECKAQNIELLDVKSITLQDVNAVKATIGSTVTSFIGGKAGYDLLQIYTMRYRGELQYFIQPFGGLTALPGQHFKVIPGSLRHPVQYGIKRKKSFSDGMYELIMDSIPVISLKKIRVCEWLCEVDSEAANLKNLKLPLLKELSHVWQTGTTLINLDWTLQACAVNKDFTLVSMQTGRYGTISERSGLNQFMQFTGFISKYAERMAGDGSNNVLISNSFLSFLFRKNYMSGPRDGQWVPDVEWLHTNKVRLVINNLKKFNHFKKLCLIGDIDEKKMANLKSCILDRQGIKENEVIAAIPMDLLNNMKSAAVLTSDKLCISYLEEYECCINLNEISGFNGTKGFTESIVELVMEDGTTTEVRVEAASEVLKAFFEQYCYI